MRVKLNIFFFVVACIFPYVTKGQFISNGGHFKVDVIKGCPNLTVKIIDTNVTPLTHKCPTCDIYWRDGTPIQQDIYTHNYTQAGAYYLRILYQNVGYDSIKINVTQDIQPPFEAYVCDGGKVSIKITDTNYDQYEVDYNGTKVTLPVGVKTDTHTLLPVGTPHPVSVNGLNLNAVDNCSPGVQQVTTYNTLPILPKIDLLTVKNSKQIKLEFKHTANVLYKLEIATNGSSSFQQYQNLYNVDSITVGNLKTDQNYYCFHIATFDPCTNTIKGYSDVICSAKFNATPQSDKNVLSWTTASVLPGITISNFTITKDGAAMPPPLASTVSTVDDNAVTCNITYKYVLTTNYSNGSKSIVTQSATAFSSKVPTAVDNITAIVTSTGVDLEWLQDPLFPTSEYSIFRSDNSLSVLTTTTSPQFTDPEYASATSFCYKISYKDLCSNVSPNSKEICPIQLSGTLQKDNSISLEWTDYLGWKNGVSKYVVEKYSSQGQLLQTFNTGTATTLQDAVLDLVNQVCIYVVKATAVDAGFNQAVSNTITIIKEPNLYYPTAFTPGSPPLNDIFNVFCQFTSQFEMKIFNRWGELLYTTTDYTQGWDGTYNGNLMPEGTYAFTADITDFAGRTFKRSGSVVLLRKK